MTKIPLLVVEDDDGRARKIEAMLPDDFRMVTAKSAGRAIGILKRDKSAYAGIMLDHDLQGNVATTADETMSGNNVVAEIIVNVAPDVPILVHSRNRAEAPRMITALERKGFSVTRISMEVLDQDNLGEWLSSVRELWEDRE